MTLRFSILRNLCRDSIINFNVLIVQSHAHKVCWTVDHGMMEPAL